MLLKKPHYGSGIKRTINNYDELFEDIMCYAPAEPESKMTQKELREYLEDIDNRKTLTFNTRNILVNTKYAEKYLKEEERSKKEAVRTELQRSPRARAADESKTAKTTKPVNPETLRQWRRNPGSFDLRGVDTRTHQYLTQEVLSRARQSRAAGFQVFVKRRGKIAYDAYRIEGKRARNIFTGRWVKR